MTEPLYILSSAYSGDEAAWTEGLTGAYHSNPTEAWEIPYNFRRLDKMVAGAVEAAIEAIQKSGLKTEDQAGLNIVGVSHNGPCIYSEEFYGELVEADNPELISPMLFSESVLNIVPSHVAIALGAKSGVFAFTTDLVNFFDIFDTLMLLAATGSWGAGLLCATEEFSPLATRLFRGCDAFPGEAFIDGALVCAFSSAPLKHSDAVGLTVSTTSNHDEALAAMRAICAAGGRVFPSAYSDAMPLDEVSVEAPLLSLEDMRTQQGFMVSRLAEVVKLVRHADAHTPVVLLQSVGSRWKWITCKHAVS
ncbi:MAG: hypothetical protein EOM20_11965 [Spartobacteria bacterium]|nr:hypothetical protein [Spartobacteria bacterium]